MVFLLSFSVLQFFYQTVCRRRGGGGQRQYTTIYSYEWIFLQIKFESLQVPQETDASPASILDFHIQTNGLGGITSRISVMDIVSTVPMITYCFRSSNFGHWQTSFTTKMFSRTWRSTMLLNTLMILTRYFLSRWLSLNDARNILARITGE